MKPITLFSWGYWGWGNATRQFCRMVDAVESERGFAPPIFVDIRYSRSVRAKGFQSGTFAEQVGQARYRWLRSLGNKAIGDRSLTDMELVDAEEGVKDLLAFTHDAAAKKRRAIFFCACECPRWKCKRNCHRDLVGKLVLEAAKDSGDRLEVVEWPGGVASDIELTVPAETANAVLRGRYFLPFGRRLPLAEAGGIAFGSRLTVRSSAGDLFAVVGPARYQNSEWVLPLFSWWTLPLSDHRGKVDPQAESATLRRQRGYEPRLTK